MWWGLLIRGQSPLKSLSGRDQGAARSVTKFGGSKGKPRQFVYNPGRWGTQEEGDRYLSSKNIWYRNTWKAWTCHLNKWDYINKLSQYVQACLCGTFLPTLLVLSASLRASYTGLGFCVELVLISGIRVPTRQESCFILLCLLNDLAQCFAILYVLGHACGFEENGTYQYLMTGFTELSH